VVAAVVIRAINKALRPLAINPTAVAADFRIQRTSKGHQEGLIKVDSNKVLLRAGVDPKGLRKEVHNPPSNPVVAADGVAAVHHRLDPQGALVDRVMDLPLPDSGAHRDHMVVVHRDSSKADIPRKTRDKAAFQVRVVDIRAREVGIPDKEAGILGRDIRLCCGFLIDMMRNDRKGQMKKCFLGYGFGDMKGWKGLGRLRMLGTE